MDSGGRSRAFDASDRPRRDRRRRRRDLSVPLPRSIADGTRTIAVGAAVEFEVVPGHLGRWEAAAVDACPPARQSRYSWASAISTKSICACAARRAASPRPRRGDRSARRPARPGRRSRARPRRDRASGRRPSSSGGVTTPRCTERELPDPDRMVDDHVGDGRGREPVVQLAHRLQLLRESVPAPAGCRGRRRRPGPRAVRGARRFQVSKVRSRSTILPRRQSREVGRYPKGWRPRPAGPTSRSSPRRVRCEEPDDVRRDGGRFPKLRRRFARAARTTRGDAALATDDARINDRIRARQVRLIGADGSQLGVRALPDALAIARESGLDLVEVAANADPPVCKIMDYGKYKYEQDQRRKESRKRASNVVIKEMKFRPKIDSHDYDTKMKHVERFLEEGSKVKLTIMFRGREMAHPELGRRILEKVAERVAEIAIVESAPKQDGRNMVDGAQSDSQARRRNRPRRPPTSERPTGKISDAEDEDAPRRGQALQDHRYRQDPAPQGVPGPPARAQALEPHAAARP